MITFSLFIKNALCIRFQVVSSDSKLCPGSDCCFYHYELQVVSVINIFTFYPDEDSAKEEARRNIEDRRLAYSNADVVVKVQGWDAGNAQSVAQACLSALKQLILSDKKLPGIQSLYYRIFVCSRYEKWSTFNTLKP